jgi:hypothetical protein
MSLNNITNITSSEANANINNTGSIVNTNNNKSNSNNININNVNPSISLKKDNFDMKNTKKPPQTQVVTVTHSRKSSYDNTQNNLKSSLIKQTEESQVETERLYEHSKSNKNDSISQSTNINLNSNNKQAVKGSVTGISGNLNSVGNINLNNNKESKEVANTLSNYMVKFNLKQNILNNNTNLKPSTNNNTNTNSSNNFKQILQNSKITLNNNNKNNYNNLNTQPNSNSNIASSIKAKVDDRILTTEASRKSLLINNKDTSKPNLHGNFGNSSNYNSQHNKKPILIQTLVSSSNQITNSSYNNLNNNNYNSVKKPLSAFGSQPQCIEINYNQSNKNSIVNNSNVNSSNVNSTPNTNNTLKPSNKLLEKEVKSNTPNLNNLLKSPEANRKIAMTDKNSPKSSTKNLQSNIKQASYKVSGYMSNYESMKKIGTKYPVNTNNSNYGTTMNKNTVDNSSLIINNNNNTGKKGSDKVNTSIALSNTDDGNTFKKEADLLSDYIKACK